MRLTPSNAASERHRSGCVLGDEDRFLVVNMISQYRLFRALRCAMFALFLALALEGLRQIAFGSFSAWSRMPASSLCVSVVFLLTFASLWKSNFKAAVVRTSADIGKIKAFETINEERREIDVLGIAGDFRKLSQAEYSLRESEDQYRLLVASIPEVVWKTDAKGNVIFVSPQVETLLGYSADEFRKKGDSLWFNSVHVDDKERVGQAFESLMKEGKPYDIECRARKKNGEWFWAHDRAVATMDSNGLRVATGLISDISVRKAGEESERRYRSLFENMLEGFAHCEMVSDDRGRPKDFVYLAVNTAFEKLTGLQNVVGRRFTEVVPEDETSRQELVERYGRVALTGMQERFEIEVKGLGMWFSISAYGAGKGCFVAVFDNITERKQAERATNLLAAIVDSSQEAIISKGLDGIISSWNKSAERLFGYTAEETIGRHISLIFPAERPHEEEWIIGQLKRVEQVEHFETVRVRKDGTLIDISVIVSPIRDASGRIVGESKLARSITERKQAEQALRQAEEKYRAIFEGALVGIFRSTLDGRYVDVNPSMARMLGYDSPLELVESITDISQQVYVDPKRREELTRLLREQGIVKNFECEVHRKDGSKMWFSANARSLSEGGVLVGYEGTNEDITARKVAEEQVQYLAYYDVLTGLPNRTLLRDRLSKALASARRNKDRVALLFLDLDRFKDINDSLGHSVGDLLLKEVAERLKTWGREQDTVARLGGDEFLITLTNLKDIPDVAVAAERLMDTMTAGFVIQGHTLNVSCSVGISIFPEHGADCETLIKNADAAMYGAKDSGRNNFRFFAEDMSAHAADRLKLENSLRLALDKKELFLVYQPQMDIATGRITGLEALLRWQQPELGLVPPDRFIRIAENSGLIVPIGEWVLRTACRQAKKWQDEGLPAISVAVNVSAVQFRQAGFCEFIRTVLHETDLDPQYLELELTETLLLANADVTLSVLKELKSMGVTLAIDDFGTGYSNFNYLRQFRVSKLKIDRTFIRDVTVNPDDAAITAAIIGMAKSLNLRVIAEGVENEAQMAFLRAHQCDEIQGYYFSKPLAVDKVADKLRGNLAKSEAGGQTDESLLSSNAHTG
jgi:diguanylate cyclase (GGDEF)-like protein/PAS domain S-box-containing protein